MKTFDAFFTYRIKGSHTADARVLVQAEDVDAAQQKITTAFQRVVDGETPKEAPPIERGHARLVWVAPVETPLDEVRKASEKPEVHAPPVVHQPAPKPAKAASGKVAAPVEPDPWIPIVAAWLRKHEMIEVSLPEVTEGAIGSESNTVTDKRMTTILRGLGYEPLRFDSWRYRSVNNQLPSKHLANASTGNTGAEKTESLTVEEVVAVREWLLSPRSGSYKRPYTKNPKLAPKTEPLTESELEVLRVDATSLGSDGVLHFTKRDPLVLRLLDEHANMKTTLAAAYETQKRDRASSVEKPDGSTEETLAVYKLRTECWADTVSLLRVVYANRVTIQNHGVNGADVTLKNPRFGDEVVSLEKLRDLIHDRIQDSHVMTETLTQERT
jgi:hypothetical protein